MQFRLINSTEITVFELEASNGAKYKVVWTSIPGMYNKHMVECWGAADDESIGPWRKLAAGFHMDGIATMKKSTDLLETIYN